MPFVGVKTGRTLEWFVPTLFKGRWKAQGDRLLREIEDEYTDVRPVPLSQAIKKVSKESVAVLVPAPSVAMEQPCEKQEGSVAVNAPRVAEPSGSKKKSKPPKFSPGGPREGETFEQYAIRMARERGYG